MDPKKDDDERTKHRERLNKFAVGLMCPYCCGIVRGRSIKNHCWLCCLVCCAETFVHSTPEEAIAEWAST